MMAGAVLSLAALTSFAVFANPGPDLGSLQSDPYEALDAYGDEPRAADGARINDSADAEGRTEGDDGRGGRHGDNRDGKHFDTSTDRGKLMEQFYNRPFYIYPQAGDVKDIEALSTMICSRNDAGDNPRLLMGSSELSYVGPMSSHPALFFGQHNYGMDTVQVGKAGYQSLWQALEIGALHQADAVPDAKVALIVGMQWFMDDGCTTESFLNSFSPEAYGRFMDNPRISDETKELVRARSLELGKEEDELNALCPENISEGIDAAIGEFLGESASLKELDWALRDNTAIPEERFGEPSQPDWDAAFALARQEAEQSCTTNDVGVYDEYYEEFFQPWLRSAEEEGKPESFTQWSEKELGDFKLYLRVCEDIGVDPLIIIMPVKAAYYDFTAYDRQSRQLYYDLIRSTCEEAGVAYVDYSAFEDDPYFMRDVMHLGWEGWLHVNRDLMEFFGADVR